MRGSGCWALLAIGCVVRIGLAADAAGTPGADAPPKRAESLTFDRQRGWVEEAPPTPGTAEGDFRIARTLLAEERYKAAYDGIRQWIKTYGPEHELYPGAALLQARIEIALKEYYRAHKHLVEFLGQYTGTIWAEEAIQYQFVIAEVFLKGTKRKVWGIFLLPAEDIGLSILDDLSANYKGTTTAELAMKTKADYYFRTGDFALAEDEYARMRQEFPRSRYVRYALKRSADAALASFPGIEYDDASLIEAEGRYTDYLVQYPGAAEQEGVGLTLDNIREQRAAKELNIAEYYRRTKHSRAAAFYYRSTQTNWPETIAAREAAGRLASLGPIEEAPEPAPAPQPPEREPPERMGEEPK